MYRSAGGVLTSNAQRSTFNGCPAGLGQNPGIYRVTDATLKKQCRNQVSVPQSVIPGGLQYDGAFEPASDRAKNHRLEFRRRPGIHAGMGIRSRKFMRHIVFGYGFRVGLYGVRLEFARCPSAQDLPQGPRPPGMTRAGTSTSFMSRWVFNVHFYFFQHPSRRQGTNRCRGVPRGSRWVWDVRWFTLIP